MDDSKYIKASICQKKAQLYGQRNNDKYKMTALMT